MLADAENRHEGLAGRDRGSSVWRFASGCRPGSEVRKVSDSERMMRASVAIEAVEGLLGDRRPFRDGDVDLRDATPPSSTLLRPNTYPQSPNPYWTLKSLKLPVYYGLLWQKASGWREEGEGGRRRAAPV
eukprot:1573443-Rhodomonas_salina.2